MTTFLSWLRQLNFDTLLDTLIVVLASLLCITVHDSCHGLSAYWLGDDTANRHRRPHHDGDLPLRLGQARPH